MSSGNPFDLDTKLSNMLFTNAINTTPHTTHGVHTSTAHTTHGGARSEPSNDLIDFTELPSSSWNTLEKNRQVRILTQQDELKPVAYISEILSDKIKFYRYNLRAKQAYVWTVKKSDIKKLYTRNVEPNAVPQSDVHVQYPQVAHSTHTPQLTSEAPTVGSTLLFNETEIGKRITNLETTVKTIEENVKKISSHLRTLYTTLEKKR